LGPLLYFIKHKAYQIVISQAVKKASRIIAVSEYTKKEIVNYFKIDPSKIEVTYEACSDFKRTSAKIDQKAFFQKIGIRLRYLLYVGNAYPHKNLELLLRAFKDLILEKSDLQLVLVGKMDYFFERLKNLANTLKLEEKVIFPGYVSDEELKALYQNAKLYVFPSKIEGFGLPPLEAMAQGLPVVSSSSSSLPEILGKAAYYFNPDKKEEISMAIKKVLADDKLREEMKKSGYDQVKKYNWEKLAHQTLKIYNSLNNAKS
jgi:glycosyltransferase involved in cell wall biosynthesis